MPDDTLLGPFEELVLLSVARLREAYGMPIRREIESRVGRAVTIGAVYSALDRLAKKGYVGLRDTSDAGEERRGRGRRYFRLEPAGATALSRAHELRQRAWEGIDPADLLGETGGAG